MPSRRPPLRWHGNRGGCSLHLVSLYAECRAVTVERVYRGLKHCALSTNEKKNDPVCVCVFYLWLFTVLTLHTIHEKALPSGFWLFSLKRRLEEGRCARFFLQVNTCLAVIESQTPPIDEPSSPLVLMSWQGPKWLQPFFWLLLAHNCLPSVL